MRWIPLALVGFICSCASPKESPRKTNVIVIMADDLGYEVLGCNGGLEYKTPNLDQMAESGLRFTNFHSTPLCTPSRVQLMTGKYNNRNYVAFGLLDSGEKTFGHYMKEAGYKTAIAGKWQLYGNATQQKLAGNRTGSLPNQAGFDEWCLWQVQDRGWRYKDPTLEINGELKELRGEYGPRVFTDFINDFIETNKDSSFFIYYPMALVHDPFEPVPDDEEYSTFERPLNDTTHFANMVYEMDQNVARITQKVEELGLLENTLILFFGDNGTDRKVVSDHVSGQIPGRKGTTLQYGTHVPFIAYGANTVSGTFEGLADLTDILPTLLDLTGVEGDPELDGHSLAQTFGGSEEKIRDWIYCYYHPNWGKRRHTEFAFNENYKLYSDGNMFSYRDDPFQLDTLPKDSFTDQRLSLQKVLDEMK